MIALLTDYWPYVAGQSSAGTALAGLAIAWLYRLSKELHGYGWDGQPDGQLEMLSDFAGEAELTSPFLCERCSRRKVRAPAQTIEARVLQEGFF